MTQAVEEATDYMELLYPLRDESALTYGGSKWGYGFVSLFQVVSEY